MIFWPAFLSLKKIIADSQRTTQKVEKRKKYLYIISKEKKIQEEGCVSNWWFKEN